MGTRNTNLVSTLAYMDVFAYTYKRKIKIWENSFARNLIFLLHSSFLQSSCTSYLKLKFWTIYLHSLPGLPQIALVSTLPALIFPNSLFTS